MTLSLQGMTKQEGNARRMLRRSPPRLCLSLSLSRYLNSLAPDALSAQGATGTMPSQPLAHNATL
jgi:hypothetical protein